MTGTPLLKRLLDTGAQFTEMSQKNAEKIVAEFVKTGELRRKDAEKTVQNLVERGRATTEYVLGLIQAEVSKQLGRFAQRLDEVETRVEEVAGNFGLGSKAPAKKATGPSGVAKVAVKKSTVKKAAAKKSSAKKSTVKKSAAKKSAARKAPAKK
jgi:polyhydroxyalkanoate synthesis regulator phasin